jgi:hypothetical protein
VGELEKLLASPERLRMVRWHNMEEWGAILLQEKLDNQENYKMDGWARSEQLLEFQHQLVKIALLSGSYKYKKPFDLK